MAEHSGKAPPKKGGEGFAANGRQRLHRSQGGANWMNSPRPRSPRT